MARTATADTLGSYVYEQIRSEILRGHFKPGERLKPADLRLRFNVSISVIREALARLAEQRLVRAEHNQGFQVTPLSETHLRDLTAVRTLVEGYALRTAIERGEVTWEGQIVAAHHVLTSTPARGEERGVTTDAWSDAHRRFHRALIEACQMPILLEMCDSLFDASELYRRLSAPYTRRNRDVVKEHREIMEATLAGDAELATSRLASHFEATTSVLLRGLSEQAAAPGASPVEPAKRRSRPARTR